MSGCYMMEKLKNYRDVYDEAIKVWWTKKALSAKPYLHHQKD
jgi:hypothetical protein